MFIHYNCPSGTHMATNDIDVEVVLHGGPQPQLLQDSLDVNWKGIRSISEGVICEHRKNESRTLHCSEAYFVEGHLGVGSTGMSGIRHNEASAPGPQRDEKAVVDESSQELRRSDVIPREASIDQALHLPERAVVSIGRFSEQSNEEHQVLMHIFAHQYSINQVEYGNLLLILQERHGIIH